MFVERREHDAVDVAPLRRVRSDFERRERGAAAGDRRAPGLDGCCVDQVQCDQRRPRGIECKRARGRDHRIEREAGDPFASGKHRWIGKDRDVHVCRQIFSREQLDGDFGTDAVRVAQ